MNAHACIQAKSELQRIFIFHAAVALFFSVIQRLGFRAILPVALVSFCNAVCLAERCWAVQRRTMDCWPMWTRVVFLMSRMLVLIAVLFGIALLLRGHFKSHSRI